MKGTVTFLLALALLAAPATAAVKSMACFPQAEALGLCTGTEQFILVAFALTPLQGQKVCEIYGWESQVLCTDELVDAGDCTAGELGTMVSNPQTCLQFGGDVVDDYWWQAIREHVLDVARAKGRSESDATVNANQEGVPAQGVE